ncbi:MAG: nucleotide exchange factor GrpE [Actinobacteria bacterium]|nr:nucleotide exchange factor GrpE [Actinomycetota bacterium]
MTGSSVGAVRSIVWLVAVIVAASVPLGAASPASAQIVPQQIDPSDAEAYRTCRDEVIDDGGDELDAARECVPQQRDFVVCIGAGRVTRAELERCVEVQVEGAYSEVPAVTTSTSAATTSTTAASTVTSDPEEAVEAVLEDAAGGEGGGDDGVGVPVVIGVGLAGLVVGALLGAARGRRGADPSGATPIPAAVPVPAPVASASTDSTAERDDLVEALIDAADQVSSDAVRTSIVHRLAAVGVEPVFVAVGDPFDPTVHRGVDAAAAPSSEQNDTIAALERPGWVDRGRVLRPPEVVVNRWEGDAT